LSRALTGVLGAALVALGGCVSEEAPPPPAEEIAQIVLEPAAFSDLAGWNADDQEGALVAFRISCERLQTLPPDRAMGTLPIAGTVGDWLPLCRVAQNVGPGEARGFFETWFRPWSVTDRGAAQGLFTGYYEPLLKGSLTPGGAYTYPLYAPPGDMVSVDLGLFAEDLEGRQITGQIEDGRFIPYWDRAQIDAGALADRELEIAWVADPVAAFFLHIQGSGRVELADGGELRVGYAGQNGRPYFAIGRELVARGELTKDEVSLQTIREWLKAHPDEAAGLMEMNASYIFFHVLEGPGPIGSQGVALTPERSLAVDRDFVPLGLPVWLDTTLPEGAPYRRLLVAQDTGGAIEGPVRGDVFFGAGPRAEDLAGHMKQQGRMWILLPGVLVADQMAALVP
jgi:membrane-bound lytic murein transglycosylase A